MLYIYAEHTRATSNNKAKRSEWEEEILNKTRTFNAMCCTTTKQTGYQYAHLSSKEWKYYLRQFCSSERSAQSASPSQRQFAGMQVILPQGN